MDPLTPDVARQLRARTRTGVVVAAVDPAGPAGEADIQPGDVIISVNRTKVADGDELKAALDRTPANRPALLLIERRGQPAYIPLERPPLSGVRWRAGPSGPPAVSLWSVRLLFAALGAPRPHAGCGLRRLR